MAKKDPVSDLTVVEYKYDPRVVVRVRERPRLVKRFFEPSLTKQEFKDECDINVLMKRYQKSGLFPQYPGQVPRYVSNIGAPDFLEAQNLVIKAREEFMSLNSELRKRFDNDPAKFLAFVSDEKNSEELVTLGLREAPKPEPGPVRVEVVNPPSDDPK